MDDGSTFLMLPSGGSLWLVASETEATAPPPEPGSEGLSWPFPLSVVTDDYRIPSRPKHDGMDFSGGPAVDGAPIACAGNGVVWRVYDQTAQVGNCVVVDHGTIFGANFKTLYAHMKHYPPVKVGDPVIKGQTLGVVGNTGLSYGAHLHFEVWLNGSGGRAEKVNPRLYVS